MSIRFPAATGLLLAALAPVGCAGPSSPFDADLDDRAEALERSLARQWRQDASSIAHNDQSVILHCLMSTRI